MKKDEIEDVVKQSFKTIHKLFHKIITIFILTILTNLELK